MGCYDRRQFECYTKHKICSWFPGVLFTSKPHNILFPKTITETLKSGEREVNAVAMTIIKPSERILAEPEIEPAISCS